jgi:hypothetical protein
VIIAPVWPTQPWYSTLMRLMTTTPRLLRHAHLLVLPHKPHLQHPLSPKLRLIACRVSAKPSPIRESRQGPETSFWPLGV